MNRLDKIVVFRALTKKEAGRVLEKQISELNQRLALTTTPLQLVVSPSAKRYLLEKGYDAHNGVRALRRTLQDEIEDHLAEAVLRGDYKTEQTVMVAAKKNKLVFSVERPVSTPRQRSKSSS